MQAQKAWSERNVDYWRSYRASHPAYTADNRVKQQARRAAKNPAVAKMDALPVAASLVEGVYQLTALDPDTLAKMGVWAVHLTLISPAASSG